MDTAGNSQKQELPVMDSCQKLVKDLTRSQSEARHHSVFEQRSVLKLVILTIVYDFFSG